MNPSSHAKFQVSVKVILWQESKVLALRTEDGYLDFPGGRIDVSEIGLPMEAVLLREVEEELGADMRITIDNLAFISRRLFHKTDGTMHVMAVFYSATYDSGGITLSDEHSEYEWVEPLSLMAHQEKFMSNDERRQLTAYFESLKRPQEYKV